MRVLRWLSCEGFRRLRLMIIRDFPERIWRVVLRRNGATMLLDVNFRNADGLATAETLSFLTRRVFLDADCFPTVWTFEANHGRSHSS